MIRLLDASLREESTLVARWRSAATPVSYGLSGRRKFRSQSSQLACDLARWIPFQCDCDEARRLTRLPTLKGERGRASEENGARGLEISLRGHLQGRLTLFLVSEAKQLPELWEITSMPAENRLVSKVDGFAVKLLDYAHLWLAFLLYSSPYGVLWPLYTGKSCSASLTR